MRTIIASGCLMGVVLLTGCSLAPNNIKGDNVRREGQFFGDVGIIGDGNDLTVLRGSRLPKLSIIGDANRVVVEEGVFLNKVEFWGDGNTVSLPELLVVRSAELGSNQIIRRPREPKPLPDWMMPAEAPSYLPPEYAPPPVEPAPAPESETVIIEEPPTRTENEALEPVEDEPHFRPPPTTEEDEPSELPEFPEK